MLGMNGTHEEYALPNLLGSTRQLQFFHDAERPPTAFAKMEASKWAVPDPSTPVANTNLSKAKVQACAAGQKTPAAKPNLQNLGRSLSTSAKPELSKAEAMHSRQARAGILPVSKAEKELMAAIARDDLNKAEKLLSEFGSSLLSGLGSHAILFTARDNLKMEKLLWAHAGVPNPQQAQMRLSRFQLMRHADKAGLTVAGPHTKEGAEAVLAGWRRTASVPHIWPLISVPERSGSNTRARRRPVYETTA